MTSKSQQPSSSTSVAADDEQIMQRLRQHLRFLGLHHTEAGLDDCFAWARRERPGYPAMLDYILGLEVDVKRDGRIERRIQTSGLKERKTLEAFNWDIQPKLDKELVLELGRLDFAEHAEDVVITGDAGTGKSHILKAIGLRACERGLSFRYARAVDLLNDLHAGLADGTYPRRFKAWVRPKLLVIDDVGIGHVRKHNNEPTAAHTLFNLIDSRHARCSTAITSNIELSDWGSYLGDNTVTTAILDRIVMHAIRLRIDGPSYRQHIADERAKAREQARKKSKSSTSSKRAAKGSKSSST